MAKKVTTRLQHTKWEATLTNLRASQKRLDKVDRHLQATVKMLLDVAARVTRLEAGYARLARMIAEH